MGLKGILLTLVHPVAVLEEDRLGAALLPCGCIGILVTLPGHVVEVCHIWAQNLPVESGILQVHLQNISEHLYVLPATWPKSAASGPAVFSLDDCALHFYPVAA